MKLNLKILITVAFLAIAPLLTFAQTGTENEPPHPSTDPPTNGGTPVGGGAPIGNGTYILLTLAMAYAGRKVYKARFSTPAEE